MPIQTHFKENFGICSLSLSLQAHFGTFSQMQSDLKQKDGKDAELLVFAWETNDPVAQTPKVVSQSKEMQRENSLCPFPKQQRAGNQFDQACKTHTVFQLDTQYPAP